jgi:hypothetical protein
VNFSLKMENELTELIVQDPEVDLVWGNWLVEIYQGASVRDVRARLMTLGYKLLQNRNAEQDAVIVCMGSKLRTETLTTELERMRALFGPTLGDRLTIVRAQDRKPYKVESLDSIGAKLETLAFSTRLATAFVGAGKETRHKKTSGSRSAKDWVLEYLLQSWLNNVGPIPVMGICRDVGVSYTTVSAVISELDSLDLLYRASNRSVELKQFPWKQWRAWLQNSGNNRATVRYASSTRLPRPVNALIDRFMRLPKDAIGNVEVSVGGVSGASQYYPRLDITASPRLDLVVYGDEADFGHEMVRRLDPSQDPVTEPAIPGDIAVHYVGRRTKRLGMRKDGVNYADPIQCLADLHELGLDAQGDEMLTHIVDRAYDQRRAPSNGNTIAE